MKKIFSLFIVFFLIETSSFAQLVLDDFKYYYMFEKKIMDIRTHKPVIDVSIPWIDPLVFDQENTLLQYFDGGIGDIKGVVSYNGNGKYIGKFNVNLYNEHCSPDWRIMLYYAENDLWSCRINHLTGKKYDAKRLTELGIFPQNVPYTKIANWYGENVLLKDHRLSRDFEGLWLLNTVDGNLKKSEINFYHQGGFLLGTKVSPNRKYVVYSKDKYSKNKQTGECNIFDMKTLKTLNLSETLFSVDEIYKNSAEPVSSWITDSTLIFAYRSINHAILKKINLNTGKTVDLMGDMDYFPTTIFEIESKIVEYGKSNNVSPNGKYIILPQLNQSNQKTYFFLNLGDIDQIVLPDLKIIPFSNNAVASYDNIEYKWASDHSIIYKLQGDITTQGTWIYDLYTQKHKRLTPFIFDRLVTLPKISKVLFVANGKLFEYDIATEKFDIVQSNVSSDKGLNYGISLYTFDPQIIGESTLKPISNVPINNKPLTTFGIVKTKEGSPLRMRREPVENSDILLKIPNTSKVKIIEYGEQTKIGSGETGKWYKIEFDGIVGWVWGNFIAIE
jgi:hypothetical protein